MDPVLKRGCRINKLRKHHTRRVPIWFLAITLLYALILAALTILNWAGADRWWFGALNLYLPQVIWIIPGLLLTILSLFGARRWVWVPLLCILWVLGPIMGLRWQVRSSPEAAHNETLRVMTWNVEQGGKNDITLLNLLYEIDWLRPDIVFLQDAGGMMRGRLGDFFRTWHVGSYGQYIIASKYPLNETEVRWISFPGEKHTCLRSRVHIGDTSVTLYNVHFQTPRWGLNPFRTARKQPWYLPKAIQQLENNVEARLTQARTIRELVQKEQGPVIVAGDLNSPDASLVCMTLRDAGIHDAFAEAGKGYGYTYGHALLKRRFPWLRASWMRIDHIMMSSHLKATLSWTGTADVSDHRPVITDIVLKAL